MIAYIGEVRAELRATNGLLVGTSAKHTRNQASGSNQFSAQNIHPLLQSCFSSPPSHCFHSPKDV